jgi:hypothetical protein
LRLKRSVAEAMQPEKKKEDPTEYKKIDSEDEE